MTTVRVSIVLANLIGAATLFAAPASLSAPPMWDTGWEVFYTGEPSSSGGSYRGTAMEDAPGQGFDLFNSGDGVKVDDFAKSYQGTSMGAEASDGWDVFRIGEGDPLP